ncbi:hypothetical protein ACFHWD_03430 [Clostridium sp. MT-14]|uniref:hypothetical protein n=1 Tax=Clostridium sp. MT-14 TaxID=3348360 RepID=UPI0035F2C10D
MCRYCDFRLRREPFGKRKILRGDFLFDDRDDCAICIYIGKIDCSKYDNRYNAKFYINCTVHDDYNSDGSVEIKYCPMCGRRLEKING